MLFLKDVCLLSCLLLASGLLPVQSYYLTSVPAAICTTGAATATVGATTATVAAPGIGIAVSKGGVAIAIAGGTAIIATAIVTGGSVALLAYAEETGYDGNNPNQMFNFPNFSEFENKTMTPCESFQIYHASTFM